jgi:hypothetical protein
MLRQAARSFVQRTNISNFHTTMSLLRERTKSDVLEDIMTWRKRFLETSNGKNPSQEDITNDPSGNLLMQEWQKLEEAEEIIEGDVMGLDSTTLALKEEIQRKLGEWKISYEKENGKKPTRDELFNDPHASKLFKEFQAITTMEWPADMRLLLTTKIESPNIS